MVIYEEEFLFVLNKFINPWVFKIFLKIIIHYFCLTSLLYKDFDIGAWDHSFYDKELLSNKYKILNYI